MIVQSKNAEANITKGDFVYYDSVNKIIKKIRSSTLNGYIIGIALDNSNSSGGQIRIWLPEKILD